MKATAWKHYKQLTSEKRVVCKPQTHLISLHTDYAHTEMRLCDAICRESEVAAV